MIKIAWWFIRTIPGTILAGWIRRKNGMETFFSKIYGWPELDDDEK
jgi:hypothetical protein